jgi:hypothetical protein
MHQQPFLQRSHLLVENRPLWGREYQTDIGFRLRGVWRHAQDTVPIRACFINVIRGLRRLSSVDGLSTNYAHPKICNKNKGGLAR